MCSAVLNRTDAITTYEKVMPENSTADLEQRFPVEILYTLKDDAILSLVI